VSSASSESTGSSGSNAWRRLGERRDEGVAIRVISMYLDNSGWNNEDQYGITSYAMSAGSSGMGRRKNETECSTIVKITL
jgi:hypothetical protein